ncbi:aspartyl protease family protein [Lysobacter terrae]
MKNIPAQVSENEFVISNGRPWIAAQIGNEKRLVLFDTGSALSVIDPKWAGRAGVVEVGRRNVSSASGRYALTQATLHDLTFAGGQLNSINILLSKSRRSLLGGNAIYRDSQILISRKGVQYGRDVRAAFRTVHCVPIMVDYSGGTTDSPAALIYLKLNINNRDHFALLDTGNAELLTGTKVSSESSQQSLPRVTVVANSDGQLAVKLYYRQKALIRIGNDSIEENYRVYPSGMGNRADFVLGARILEHYSIYLDYRHGIGCFVR